MTRVATEHNSKLTTKQTYVVRDNSRFLSRTPAGQWFTLQSVWEDDARDIDATYVPLNPTESAAYDDNSSGSGVLLTLQRNGLIECVEQRVHNGDRYYIWSTLNAARERAHEHLTPADETAIPGCTHTGIHNCGDGQFTCCTETCDNTVERNSVRR